MNRIVQSTLGLSLSLGLALTMSNVAGATDLHVMITGALTGAMRDLQPRYEQASGNKLVISWGPSS